MYSNSRNIICKDECLTLNQIFVGDATVAFTQGHIQSQGGNTCVNSNDLFELLSMPFLFRWLEGGGAMVPTEIHAHKHVNVLAGLSTRTSSWLNEVID
jgi:hypothetical protein